MTTDELRAALDKALQYSGEAEAMKWCELFRENIHDVLYGDDISLKEGNDILGATLADYEKFKRGGGE